MELPYLVFKRKQWVRGLSWRVWDDALGVTATYNNGQAEAKGVKYFVNFVEYVKKDGEKFLVIINQAPKKALETHADALEKTIKSIKVK